MIKISKREAELAKKIWDGTVTSEESREYEELHRKGIAAEFEKKKAKSAEMRNRRRRGKYAEKKVAKDVGGKADGRAGKKDVVQGMFHYEVKSHKRVPKYLQNIMNEAVRLASKDKIPVGVIYDRTNREYYYIVTKNTWLDLHGK